MYECALYRLNCHGKGMRRQLHSAMQKESEVGLPHLQVRVNRTSQDRAEANTENTDFGESSAMKRGQCVADASLLAVSAVVTEFGAAAAMHTASNKITPKTKPPDQNALRPRPKQL